MDKDIHQVLKQLQHEKSTDEQAEDYCRRLKTLKRKLVMFDVEAVDHLVAMQESIVAAAAQPYTQNVTLEHAVAAQSVLISRQPRSSEISISSTVQKPKQIKNVQGEPHVKAPATESPIPTNSSVFASKVTPPASTASLVHRDHIKHSDSPGPVAPSQSLQPLASLSVQPAAARAPPPLGLSVYSIASRTHRYGVNSRYETIKIRFGSAQPGVRHAVCTHWLLMSPESIGVIKWSRYSNLVIAQSVDYVQVIAGDSLHIEADCTNEAGRLAAYINQWYPNARIFEVHPYVWLSSLPSITDKSTAPISAKRSLTGLSDYKALADIQHTHAAGDLSRKRTESWKFRR
ncbi:MAG: hypothetical protein L6R39_004971 [Caloplaca ligustica]|nr:MAG: hypothetical protein L6R39_004971 [Caloplaca ligustica]